MASLARAYDLTPEREARERKLAAWNANLHPKYGDVPLIIGDVTLHLGWDYYFINAEEARKVLVDEWDNPPGNTANVIA